MRLFRSNKILGLAIGDRSLQIAELVAAERPRVEGLAEFAYPDGTSLGAPGVLGLALGRFLQEHGFTAGRAVVGLPAKWLLVKSKEVPPADDATTNRMLRLQAETEFSSELKELVYDYVPGASTDGGTRSVLLLATQRQYVTAAELLCRSAKLTLDAIVPQAVALAARVSGSSNCILHLHGDSAEIAAQTAGAPTAIRYLRASAFQPQLAAELRRALAAIVGRHRPGSLLVWNDVPIDPVLLGHQIGLPMRIGQLPELGVDLHVNGASSPDGTVGDGQYAPAIALALSALERRPPINFLHSRLAPPRTQRVPRWSILAATAVLVILLGGIHVWRDLQRQQANLQTLQSRVDSMSGTIKTADAFVAMVHFARQWHGGDPRYLLCLRDLTVAIPQDGRTYATSLILREASANPSAAKSAGQNTKPTDSRMIAGQLYGKTGDQQAVQTLIDRLKRAGGFADVKLGGTQNAGRAGEVAFSVTFTYASSASSAPPTPSPVHSAINGTTRQP